MTQQSIIIILLTGLMGTLSTISYFQYTQYQALEKQYLISQEQDQLLKELHELIMKKEQKEKEAKTMEEGLYRGIDELQRATDEAMKKYNN